MIFLESQHKGEVAIQIGNYFQRLELLLFVFSIYTLSDLGVLSNLIGSLSLANEHYSPPTE